MALNSYKLHTIVYNKANTKTKKTGKYAHSTYLPVEIKKADDGNRTRDMSAKSSENTLLFFFVLHFVLQICKIIICL